jgi:RNA polymerase sigma factor (sigma-70 family)
MADLSHQAGLRHLLSAMADDAERSCSLRRARSSAAAFVEFYREHAEGLLVYFVRRTFDIEVARDLTAETFARAFEHRRRFRGTTAADATGWLYGIAHHQLSHYLRRGVVHLRALEHLSIELPVVDDDDLQRIVELGGLDGMRGRLEAALKNLDREQRRAIELRIVEERPYAEVAACLGVSEQTARARVSRALRKLAARLDSVAISEVSR